MAEETAEEKFARLGVKETVEEKFARYGSEGITEEEWEEWENAWKPELE